MSLLNPTQLIPQKVLTLSSEKLTIVRPCPQERSGKVWTHVKDVDSSKVYQTVTLRGRVHNVRGKGKSAFLVLRQQTATIQAWQKGSLAFKNK